MVTIVTMNLGPGAGAPDIVTIVTTVTGIIHHSFHQSFSGFRWEVKTENHGVTFRDPIPKVRKRTIRTRPIFNGHYLGKLCFLLPKNRKWVNDSFTPFPLVGETSPSPFDSFSNWPRTCRRWFFVFPPGVNCKKWKCVGAAFNTIPSSLAIGHRENTVPKRDGIWKGMNRHEG